VPVMAHEVLAELALQPDLVIVDGTLGAGGHSQQILSRMSSSCRLIGLDRDPTMLRRAAQVLQDSRVELRCSSYAQLDQVLDELQIPQIDRLLVDLGLSSDQLADPHRGFGFETAGPLDMRFDLESGRSAAELLATADAAELADIFMKYGEEPLAQKIAEAIVTERRAGQGITLASQLKQLIERLSPVIKGKSHPATRVFQALRIAVNQELEQLQTLLDDVLVRRLKPGGRALVITFHSLEDRLVKQAFRDVTLWNNLTRKPLTAAPSEVRWNPRSRSAKLRVAERTENMP